MLIETHFLTRDIDIDKAQTLADRKTETLKNTWSIEFLINQIENSFTFQTVIFQSELSHPLICPYTGLLNISDAFGSWNHTEDHLWQVLKYVQFVFEHPVGCVNEDRTNVANKEIYELVRENKMNEFKEKVKECVRISKDKVYDAPPTEDKHYITFNLFDEDVHKGVLDSIRNQTDASSISPPPTGLSWVKPGEFKPLSKWCFGAN